MEIKRDWKIVLDEDRMIEAQGQALQRLLQRPGMFDTFRALLQEAAALIDPVAAWDYFPIKEVLHERLVLENGTKIGGGPVVSVVGGAEELAVAVCSIGSALDERVTDYKQARDLLKAMMLDELGSWAVDMVRQELCHWLEAEARDKGWRTSASLSPGESVWSVKDQAVIFSLLDTAQIDVSLSPAMVMHPLKSLSLILGRGSEQMGVEDGSNCDFCTLRDHCRYREAREVLV